MTKKILKYKPYRCYKDIYSIDYDKLKVENFKTIFFDIDNTIGSLKAPFPSLEAINLFKHLKELGFECILWSNSPYKRVKAYGEALNVKFIHRAYKPFKFNINVYAYNNLISFSNALSIGDQLTTDCLVSSKLHIPCILVAPIDKESELRITKFNRRRANKKIVEKFKDIDIETYNAIRSIQDGKN